MKRLRNRTALYSVLFSVAALAVMLYIATGEYLAISDTAEAKAPDDTGAFEIVRLSSDLADDILLPLPAGVHYENISLEQRYLTQHLTVSIRTGHLSFYRDQSVPCNTGKVTDVFCTTEDAGVIHLTFALDALYEPDVEISGAQLKIKLTPPEEKYDTIVIVDPAYNGVGTDVALHLALRLSDLSAKKNNGVRIYLTRTRSVTQDDTASLHLAQMSGADRYLRLTVTSGETEAAAATWFYDGFFIRGYGNAAFAADIEHRLSMLQQKGVSSDTDDVVLRQLKIPAALVRIDGIRGVTGDYGTLLEQIASAIYDCISTAD